MKPSAKLINILQSVKQNCKNIDLLLQKFNKPAQNVNEMAFLIHQYRFQRLTLLPSKGIDFAFALPHPSTRQALSAEAQSAALGKLS